MGDEPLLFHCGLQNSFDEAAHVASKVTRLHNIRWIAFGHLEADETGALDQWLAAAPLAQVVQGAVGVQMTLRDSGGRTPRAIADGGLLDIGGKRLRHFDTPHVPHAWDARVLYEEVTGTLLCGDLFTHTGDGPPVRDDDIVERSLASDDTCPTTCLTPKTAPTIRRLAELEPITLAVMHGASYNGGCRDALHALADGYEDRLLSQMP